MVAKVAIVVKVAISSFLYRMSISLCPYGTAQQKSLARHTG